MIQSQIANVLWVRRALSPPQKRELIIKMSDSFKGATVTITVLMKRDVRYRLGMFLVRLGLRVLGARSEIVPGCPGCANDCGCAPFPVSSNGEYSISE